MTPNRSQAGDGVWASILGVLVLAVYLVTLFPGLGGGGDSIKFQFAGSVLGTPHPPGYPLYILISFLFSKIPAGTPAWRINFMSAFFATAAVMLAFVAMRRLGCRRWVAASAALALAFDRYMWSKAVHAEVYTLAGALVAATVVCAIRWRDSGRRRDLYLLVGMFALSLGNHLTVTTLVPGLLVFILLTDWRAVTPRTIAVSAFILAAGVAQYGLIWLRTVQGAPYLEARATSLRELFQVMRASRFAYQVFAFSPGQLILERVPILWHVCVGEFNPLGVILVLAGVAALAIRRERVGALLVLGAGGILFLTLNVDADVEGFLVPAFVMMWMIAGFGFEALLQVPGLSTAAGVPVVAVLVLALPSWQLRRNYAYNDHHRRTFETRYAEALFDLLDQRSAVVSESYSIDHLIYYKLLAEHAAAGRQIEIVPKDVTVVRQLAERGFAVFAFSEGRTFLEANGVRLRPVTLPQPRSPGGPIDMSALPLFRMVRIAGCHDVGNTDWQDISDTPPGDGRLLVRIDNYRPFEARVTLYAGAGASGWETAEPLLAISRGPQPSRVTVDAFEGPDSAALRAALKQDGVTAPGRLLKQPRVRRIGVTVNDQGDFSWSALDLRTRPDVLMVRAVVDLNNPKRATVCGWSGQDLFESGDVEHISLGRDGETLFGTGWHASEQPDAGALFRWTAAKAADVLVPLAQTGTIRVRVRALPFDYPGAAPHALSLTLNGVTFPAQAMAANWAIYEWTVPESAWRSGFNRLLIVSSTLGSPASDHHSTDTRQLGVAVSELTLIRSH